MVQHPDLSSVEVLETEYIGFWWLFWSLSSLQFNISIKKKKKRRKSVYQN